MSALRASWLAWGAVVALLAYPAQAQVIGQERCILGGEEGFFRCLPAGGEDTVTIDAMPYERTVTCDTYTVTGTFTGSAPTGWSASPSGDTGSCTNLGGGTFSCVVDVDPDASGEGVETITIGNDSVDIGFYVSGSHSCFLTQSVDGSYNSTLADNDPVATWENLGTSALDVTQGTAANQPTFKTSIVNGSPVVRCDGNDNLSAATASDWTFLHDGTTHTEDIVYNPTVANPGVGTTLLATTNTALLRNAFSMNHGDSGTNEFYQGRVYNASTTTLSINTAANTFPTTKFSLITSILENTGGVDLTVYSNGSSIGTASGGVYSSTDPPFPLTLCSHGNSTGYATGDVFRVAIYQSALDATQRAINQSVDEWALGGTLPVTP